LVIKEFFLEKEKFLFPYPEEKIGPDYAMPMCTIVIYFFPLLESGFK
jgi:hypothetical protein